MNRIMNRKKCEFQRNRVTEEIALSKEEKMKEELRKYLNKMIENEWNRYRTDVLEESSEKIIKDNNIWVSYEDWEFLGEDIVFNGIFKLNGELYGIKDSYYLDTNEDDIYDEVYSIYKIDPMILLDDEYERRKEEDELYYLIDDYEIEFSDFNILVHSETKYFNGERYMCYFKPVLVEEEKE